LETNVKEYMVINFSAATLDIDELWDSSALSAKFLSGFWGYFFPKGDKEARQIRNELEDSVRYISAELLGNAVKYNFSPEFIIKIGLYVVRGELRFYVTNSVDPDIISEFQNFIQSIMKEDLKKLYLTQMEKNAKKGSFESRIGFLTIMLNYESILAWKFEKDENIDVVTTMARLPIVRNI
ncbi:hypothetical protein QUF70_17295, partial [Desulfobacterales bacterium HSG17]|nr:hypothetical protein [Desulfobacterales bacterium HSG17]